MHQGGWSNKGAGLGNQGASPGIKGGWSRDQGVSLDMLLFLVEHKQVRCFMFTGVHAQGS